MSKIFQKCNKKIARIFVQKSKKWSNKTNHTIRKCQKMAKQNTFKILLLNDANLIGEHKETRMKMPNTEGSCLMLLLGPGKSRISQKSH